ncbi:MAG: hypothetical protein LBG70_01855 [Bifidobacteriaceae bacterium]|jgi:diacylglycerol kinase (ATP)|nr:hypothetical protein [Bifidobacteriaceae bacterium]
MAKQRLGVVINPVAGAGRGRSQGGRAVELLSALGYEVIDLSAEQGLAQARAQAKQGLFSGLDALIMVGGDGMVNLGVNLVATTNLPLGVIAQGTGNDIARSLGLPIRDTKSAVAQIDQALTTGQIAAIDAVNVTDAVHSRMAMWYAGVLSAGFDAAVNARTNRLRWPSGRGRYVRALGKEIANLKTFGYRVTVDDQVFDLAGTLVSVANGQAIGGGMRIAPQARFNDGLLDVVLAGQLSRFGLIKVFPKVYRGGHLGHPAVRLVRGRMVLIEPNLACGAHPPQAMADGEMLGPLPLRCQVIPAAVRVLAQITP